MFLPKKTGRERPVFPAASAEKEVYAGCALTLVGCSKWISELAARSAVLREDNTDTPGPGFRVENIPNPIDVSAFYPYDAYQMAQTEDKLGLSPAKFRILFGAVKLSAKRKGVDFFVEALRMLHGQYPETTESVELVLFGQADEGWFQALPFKVHYLGTLSGEAALADAYNVSHVFVMPSLEENLPNVIMESLACGTPAVAFRVGGIPDLIDHRRNGYLAKYMAADDLCRGIHWVWQLYQQATPEPTNPAETYTRLADEARRKVLDYFTEEKVSQQYIRLYQDMLTAQNPSRHG
ncbi:MAG: glycosyltransferase [Bacteroidia bacterium]|nr:glycosyltransferase [Bacteroidia bacterium]